MGVYHKDSGAWSTPPAIYVKDNGAWREANTVWVKDAGIWKQCHQSDITPPAVPQLDLEVISSRYIAVKIKASNSLDPTLDIVRVLISSTAYPPNQFASGFVSTPDTTYPNEPWSEFEYNQTGGHVETTQYIKEYPPNPTSTTALPGSSNWYVGAWAKDKKGNWSAGDFATVKIPDRSTPVPGVPTKKVLQLRADWSQTFNGDDSLRWSNVNLTQGYWNAFNGNQESVIGFPHETIVAALKNATVLKVEIYMYAQKAYNKTFLARNLFHSASAPQGSMATIPRFGTPTFEEFATAQGKWYDITSMGTAGWKSGQVKGLTFQPNTFDRHYSGIFDGHTQTRPPQLRITYEV